LRFPQKRRAPEPKPFVGVEVSWDASRPLRRGSRRWTAFGRSGERFGLPPWVEAVSKLEHAQSRRTICTSRRSCTEDFPVYWALREIKLLHGAAPARFDTASVDSRRCGGDSERLQSVLRSPSLGFDGGRLLAGTVNSRRRRGADTRCVGAANERRLAAPLRNSRYRPRGVINRGPLSAGLATGPHLIRTRYAARFVRVLHSRFSPRGG
jgi:hypothetical protein